MKKEHSCTHLKNWKTKMTSTVQTLRRKMSWILFVLLLQHKKKLILVKNNETETCVKLDPNRILEVEIKINICKIQSKHDKAIFPTHAIQKVNGNVSSVYGMMIFYETFTFKHQVSGNSVSIQSVTCA